MHVQSLVHQFTSTRWVTASTSKGFLKGRKDLQSDPLKPYVYDSFPLCGLLELLELQSSSVLAQIYISKLQQAYQVSRLAIHIGVSQEMTVSAVARIDGVKRQIRSDWDCYCKHVTSLPNFQTTLFENPFTDSMRHCLQFWMFFLYSLLHSPDLDVDRRLHTSHE